MANFVDFYQLLQISTTATEEEIKHAIREGRKEARTRSNHHTQEKRAEGEQKMSNVAKAEKILLDSASRKNYDSELKKFQFSQTEAKQTPVDLPSRVKVGRDYLQSGNSKLAHKKAVEVTQLDNSYLDAWRLRADASINLEKLDDAEYSLNEVARLAPSDPDTYEQLAYLYSIMNQEKRALSNAHKAFNLRDTPRQLVVLASFQVSAGELREGIENISRAYEDAPEDPWVNSMYLQVLDEAYREQLSRDAGGKFWATNSNQFQLGMNILSKANRIARKLLENTPRGDSASVSDTPTRNFMEVLHKALDHPMIKRTLPAWSNIRPNTRIVILVSAILILGPPAGFIFQLLSGLVAFLAFVIFMCSITGLIAFRKLIGQRLKIRATRATVKLLEKHGLTRAAESLNDLSETVWLFTKVKFRLGRLWAYIFLMLLTFAISISGAGQSLVILLTGVIISFGLIPYVYFVRHLTPAYVSNSKLATPEQKATGLQPGELGVF